MCNNQQTTCVGAIITVIFQFSVQSLVVFRALGRDTAIYQSVWKIESKQGGLSCRDDVPADFPAQPVADGDRSMALPEAAGARAPYFGWPRAGFYCNNRYVGMKTYGDMGAVKKTPKTS